MTYASALTDSPPANQLTPRMVLAAWRSITRAQLWTTILLGSAYLLYQTILGQAPGGADWLILFVFDEIKAFALLLAVVVADRTTGADPERRGVYTLAVVVGAAAGALATAAAVIVLQSVNIWSANTRPDPLYIFLEVLMVGGAVVWVAMDRRRAARARELMHRAELERIDAAKRTVESELQAMQARVEPQFLFSTLAQVRELYRADAMRGERMLDELIAYLRAAMPKMRDTSSTVGQEIELARAYLAIVKVRLGDRLTYEIVMPDAASDVRMPPMMLLPLIDHAIVHGPSDAPSSEFICIRGSIVDQKIRLEIADSMISFVTERQEEGIRNICQRLAALYESKANLVLQRRAQGGSEAILEIPTEPAAHVATIDTLLPPSATALSGVAA